MHCPTWPLILILSFTAIGCGSRSTTPTAKPATTVSSLADLTRRLELAGYSYVKESNALGEQFVNYARDTPEAAYSVEIVRWSGDPRLKSLIFHCRTNEAAFNSKESRRKLWTRIDADVCGIVNGRQDYLRALADMKEANGTGISRFEGRATTAEGWQIHAIEYVAYYKREAGETESKIPMAMIVLTHLEIEEDMPASALLDFNRQLEDAKRK
jgi:hypothetical protein